MFFCIECNEIVSTDKMNRFSYYDKRNTCCNVCTICYNKIDNMLVSYDNDLLIDYSKLTLLKKKIKLRMH